MTDFSRDHAMPSKHASAEISGGNKMEPMQETYLDPGQWDALDPVAKEGFTVNDQQDMQRLGKQQQFRRNFRFVSTVGFTCCVMGTWEILLTSNTPALLAGGSGGLFWSLCWCYVGQMFIVLSLAEMASMAPTAGGQYHWVSEFAPQSAQRLFSYLSGWLATISWQSIVALDCFIVGTIVQSCIIINNESYADTSTAWQGTLLVFASAIGIGLFNMFAAKHLPFAEGIFVASHFFAFFPVIITILVLAPKTSAQEVFFTFSDNGAGWPNIGWSVLVGQVSAMFSLIASDSVAHMAEEVEEAGITVPRSMIWAFFLNVPCTFGLLLTYLFCMPSVQDAVDDPTGYPFVYVFRQATGSREGTLGMTVVILLLLIMITISSMASTSRQTFAFARDNGLPFSAWLAHVHNTWHVPFNSILFTVVYTCLISLINIGSEAAFNAIISLATVALMGTYMVSISCVLLRRIRGQYLPPARWTLGKAGLPINFCGLIYSTWAFFWGFWPTSYDPTAETFNWACLLFVVLMGLGTVLYFTHAKKVYEGPVAIVEDRDKLR